MGNPLTFVDPSGFQPATGVVSQPGFPDVSFPYDEIKAGYGAQVARYLNHQGPPPSEPDDSMSDAAEFGAAAPPTDVDTTGSSPEIDAQAATTAPEDLTQNPYVPALRPDHRDRRKLVRVIRPVAELPLRVQAPAQDRARLH